MMLKIIKNYLYLLKKDFELNLLKIKWRKLNPHNFTSISNKIDFKKIKVGSYTYGLINAIHSYGAQNEFLSIGHFCSISTNVYFILGGEHNYHLPSTYPFNTFFLNNKIDSFSKGSITLEDDVWVGHGSVLLSGITIKKGTVIAAGSIVTKSTEPYSIVGGNPAKIIKYRFNQELIRELDKIDFSKINKNNYLLLSELLNSSCELDNLKKIVNLVQSLK
jgi:acetyltransferase-like isoleucine patch superfamily enzyme